METDRLRYLVELERLGSMRAVADEMLTTTSRVSHQLSLLATETGARLLEPVGRNVRLTAAGRRLAERGRIVLAEVEAARAEASGESEPAGTVRVVAFATAIRSVILPLMLSLAEMWPSVRIVVTEHEPDDARRLLLSDQADLAIVYDYDLAPAAHGPDLTVVDLWTTEWCLAVPAAMEGLEGDSVDIVSRLAASPWIGNSRNGADEQVIAILCSMAGLVPEVRHRCDDLDVVADLISAGEGVGLFPVGRAVPPGVVLVPLAQPGLRLRASALHRSGRTLWPPMRAVVEGLSRDTT
jgi:DNA-binding transcriptional LysR family regulator